MSINLNDLVWVKLKKEFLVVRETLTRMGVATKDKTLWQSCLILHKKGQYAIVHFKEMFLLDGKASDITEDDIARRNTIANLIEEWGLIEIEDKNKTKRPVVPVSDIKIIHASDKANWNLRSKYTIGNQRS